MHKILASQTVSDIDLKKFVNDCQLVNNEDDYQCPICLGLVYKPKTCAKCQNFLFCSTCLDEMKKKECPYCKDDDFIDIHTLLRNMLNKAEVKCKIDDCNDKCLTYDILVSNHAKSHLVNVIKCPIGCGTVLLCDQDNIRKAKKHYFSCPLMVTLCNICK